MKIGPQTPAADALHAMKYRSSGEDFREAMNRVAFALKDTDENFYDLRDALLMQRFVPAGRIQSAIGSTKIVTGYNCFVSLPIEDSFVDGPGNIMQRAAEAARTMRMGGGIGYDFSTLRPRGDLIRKLQSNASGPVSFMQIFNAVCLATSSSGHRRGAQMGTLRVDHPSIEEFVHAKQNTNSLTGFNISVAITDEFLEAAYEGKPFTLRFGGREYQTIDAAALWESIMRSTWDWGEPGVIFIDRMNNENNLWYCEKIHTTNPCFAPGTLITTSKGAFPIEDLVGREVTIHDGTDWRTIDNFRQTGTDQQILKVTLYDGSSIRVTPQHAVILESGERIEAQHLTIGMRLAPSIIECDGNVSEKGAYLKGFLLGDGSVKHGDRPMLYLYEPKYCCMTKLAASGAEIDPTTFNTNSIENLYFTEQFTGRQNRKAMQGLTVRKPDLLNWCSTFKTELPSIIYQWNRASKCEFIAGLFDADGTAMNSMNGFGYQIASIEKSFLLSLQTLLKTIGVQSKLALMRKSGLQIFPEDKVYTSQDCWRLTISQISAIELSRQVEFYRLQAFSDRTTTYKKKINRNVVVAIEADGIEDAVYCCTVSNSHSIALTTGLLVGQCSEQPLPPGGACNLGSINLVKYLSKQLNNDYSLDFSMIAADVALAVRAMDNVIDRTRYPLAEQKAEALSKRRLGLGVMGLANAIETLGHQYASPAFCESEARILEFIRDCAYRTSIDLAVEKGAFPLFDAERFLQGRFAQTLPSDIRDGIAAHGLRNSHLTSIAPTGTISLCADNVSSGVEPVWEYEKERPINTPTGIETYKLVDYAVANFNVYGRQALDIAPLEHVDVLTTAQKYVDSAISKTVNVPYTTSWEAFKDIYRQAWEGGAKSCATFTTGGKRAGLLVSALDKVSEPQSVLACFVDPSTGERSCE